MSVSLNAREKTHSDTFQCRKEQAKRTEIPQKKRIPIDVNAAKRDENHAKKMQSDTFQCRKEQAKRTENHRKKRNPIHASYVCKE
jgi:hypothetical protein